MVVFIALFLSLFLSCQSGVNDVSFLQKVLDQNLTADEKATLILEEMTTEEKMMFIRGEGWKNHGTVERLGLPTVSVEDSSSGIFLKGTSFPAPLVAACSWNRSLLTEMGAAIAEEGRAYGKSVILAPGVNIYRMPTCGRNFEYFGEDPYLASEMAVAYIGGMQQNGTVAVIKHLAANNQDYDRHTISSDIDERTLREIYLPAFEKAVKAGVGAVMTGYNPVNGFPMAENKRLITDILKEEWGFRGFVMSDFYSVYSTEGSFVAGLDLEMPEKSGFYSLSRLKSLKVENKETLLDDKVFRILRTYISFGVYDYLLNRNAGVPADFEKNNLLARRIAEEGIVLLKNEDSLLPFTPDKKQTILITGYNGYHLNTTAVGACTVFNGRPGRLMTLNLANGFKSYQTKNTKIRMAGVSDIASIRKADAVIYVAGLWIFGEGEVNDRSWDLKEKQIKDIKKLKELNPNVIVVSNYGSGIETESWIDDVKCFLHVGIAGKWADVALARILFGDVNPSGKLPYTMVKYWEDFAPVAAQNAHPDQFVVMPRETRYNEFPMMGVGPGKGYGGDPRILKSRNTDIFEYSPDAYDKMKHMEYAEGRYLGYRFLDKVNRRAQFPFGFGLSYTQFQISDCHVSGNVSASAFGKEKNESFTVSVSVTNSGSRAGAEIVQFYVHALNPKADRVYKELKGFEKVFLQPGETKRVSVCLGEEAFRRYDPNVKKWVVDAGEYLVMIGNSAENLPVSGKVTIGL